MKNFNILSKARWLVTIILLTALGSGNVWGIDYTLTTTITDGDYVIGCINGTAGTDNSIQAINATITSGWGKYATVTPSGGKITNPSSDIVWTLTKISANSFSLKNGSVYYKITTSTGSGSVATQASSSTIYFAAVGGSTNAFELSGVSSFTVSSGNQLACNQASGYGYRQYTQRTHETTATGISTQVRFYKKASPHTVTLMDDNSELEEASAGAGVTLPSRDGCPGYTFVGWTASWTEEQDEWTQVAPAIIPAGLYNPISDINLYPVYRKGSGAASATITTTLTAGKQYVIGAVKAAPSATLANNTAIGAIGFTGLFSSTSWGQYTTYTPNTSGEITAAIGSQYIWTLESITSGKYSFKNNNNASYPYIYLKTGTGQNSAGLNTTGQVYLENVSATCKDAFKLHPGSSDTRKLLLNTGSNYGYRVYANDQSESASMCPYIRFYEYNIDYYYISVPDCCTDPGLAYGTASVTKTYGNSAFTNTLTNSHSVAVTYALSSVSPAGCVSINASTGQVTINGAGSATVTASSIAQTVSTVDYCADEASYTLTVNKANISPTLSYTPNSVAVGESTSAPTVGGNPGSGGVTYAITSATPSGCATINTSTGVVTGVAVGSVTVTATVAATANYNGGTATATVNITAASNFINGETVFVLGKSSNGGAWVDNACVKACFHAAGVYDPKQETYWIYDITEGGKNGNKMFAVVVPASGDFPYLDLYRFNPDCSSLWNSNGGASKAESGSSNIIQTVGGGTNDVSWYTPALELHLMGDPNSWASSLATFSDQGAGVWEATYNNYAPANAAGESQSFKINDNYGGWFATDNGQNVTLDGMHVGSTYNITATYDIPTHTLTMGKTYVKGTVHFNMNDHGSAIADLTNVAAGSKISAPSAPTETGWTFGGWYKEAGCTNEWNFGSDVVNETMTLYAKWTIKTTTISFNQNGGTGGQTTTKTATYGSAMPTPITCPTRTGYDFGGYYESSGGTGTQYYTNAGASARTWNKENATWTLYAKWTAKTYTISFDQNGGTGGQTTTKTATYGSAMPTPITCPTRDGYAFGGYYDGAGGTGTQYYTSTGTSARNWDKTSNTTLYAKWEAAKVFTLATSGTTLVDGDEIVIMNNTSTYAMSTTQNTSTRGQTNTDLSVAGSTLTVYATSDAQVISLEESGGYLLFNVSENKYLYCGSTDSNPHLKTLDLTDENTYAIFDTDKSKWSCSIDGSNNATITSKSSVDRKYLKYNSNVFNCYGTGTGSLVKVYLHHISTPFVRCYPDAPQTFQYAVGYGPSLAQALHVKGYNLTGNLTVTCPSGYELSATSNANDFAASNLTLTASSNKVNTTIYIRLAAGKSAGSYNANLAISGGGITTTNVPLVGQVTAAESTGEMYRAVLDATDIFPYDTLVLLNDTGTWIMSKEQNTNNRTAINTGFIYKGTTVYVTDGYANVQKIITEECSTNDRWLLKAWNTTNYLYAAAPSDNKLKSGAKGTVTTDHKGEWQLETNATGMATIHAPESSMRDTINFNYNSGTPIFNCYNRFLNVKNGGTTLYYRISPNIWCKPSSLTGFSVDYGAGASAAQTFTVQGKNLGENIVTLTAPTGYEISKTSSTTGYATEQTLTPTNGRITSTTIWVRITAGNEAGTYNGEITATATGAATRTVTLEGVVNPVPNITLATTSSTLLVTSRNGVNIMATNTLTLNISGAVPGQAVSFTAAGLKFYKKITESPAHYVELTGGNALTAPVTNQVVYVSYNPTTTGTGAIASPDIQVSCNGTNETFSGKIKVRNLPDAVAIVAHTGDSWQALPANMSGAQNPGPVVVSVASVDGILTASGASTLAYKLWPVKTTNGSGDRFGTYSSPSALYADRVRFAGNSDKGLWSNDNKSTNTINNNAAITTVGADVTTGYEWIITTTESDGQFVYNLTSTHGSNNNDLRFWLAASGGPKWGTYANGIQNLYILPLTEITEADITVMEWGTNKIAVSYPNRASCTALTAKIGTNSPTAVTINSIGGDIYELTGVGDLQGNPAKTLVLSATEGSAKQKILSIPYIITADGVAEATIRAAVGDDVAKLTDVVICNGGKLTTGTASGVFNDLYIYPGGKADISLDIALNHVYMRGGFSWLGSAYKHPQMNVAAGKTISGIGNGAIYYDLYLDNAMYYMFALPKTVAVTAITNEENGNDWDAWIKSYSGEGRASNPKVSGWSYVTSGNIERGAGYEIAIKPRLSRPYGILRFPLLKNTAWSDETACAPSITGWGVNDDNVTANNKGWNIIGNPYMTAYNNTALPSGKIQTQTLVQHKPDGVNWDGTYEWSTTDVKYFTIPKYTDYDYEDVRAFPYKLDAFFPFFIQASGDGTVSFSASNKTLKLPSRMAKEQAREVAVDFVLKNANDETDVAGLNISNEYAAGFDEDDKEKTILNGLAYMKVYTLVGDYRTAFNSLPEDAAALPIPVGYIAPQTGDYTFSMVESDYSEVEHVWLTDYEMSSTVDLLEGSYEFHTNNGAFNERFTIHVILRPKVPTGVDNIDADSYFDQPVKFLYHDQMYILLNGVIYDATGKKVREINK